MSRADALRTVLLNERSASLRRRRGIAVLSALAMADAAVVALRQLGAIGPLPEPPGPFDSDDVVTAPEAYALGVPDAALGALVHGAALALAGAGVGTGRGRRIGALLLAATVGAGAVGTWAYNALMFTRHSRLCPYCLTAGALSAGAVALVVPEAVASLRARRYPDAGARVAEAGRVRPTRSRTRRQREARGLHGGRAGRVLPRWDQRARDELDEPRLERAIAVIHAGPTRSGSATTSTAAPPSRSMPSRMWT